MGAHALKAGETVMGLRGPKPEERKILKAFRFPESLAEYLEEVSKRTGRDQTQIILEAITLDREIEYGLTHEGTLLKQYGVEHGCDPATDLHKILVLVVKEGMARYAAEKGHPIPPPAGTEKKSKR